MCIRDREKNLAELRHHVATWTSWQSNAPRMGDASPVTSDNMDIDLDTDIGCLQVYINEIFHALSFVSTTSWLQNDYQCEHAKGFLILQQQLDAHVTATDYNNEWFDRNAHRLLTTVLKEEFDDLYTAFDRNARSIPNTISEVHGRVSRLESLHDRQSNLNDQNLNRILAAEEKRGVFYRGRHLEHGRREARCEGLRVPEECGRASGCQGPQ